MTAVRWFAVSLIICLVAAVSMPAARAEALPVAFDGHFYEYVAADHISWTDANAAASSLSYAGLHGHLATVTSPEENAFITDLLPVVVAVFNEVTQEAYLGGIQLDSRGAVTDGWAWVTGEPWSYTNWAGFEPNNAGAEIYLGIWMADVAGTTRVRGGWNNASNSGLLDAGYVVEYAAPEPEPTLLAGLGVIALGLVASLR